MTIKALSDTTAQRRPLSDIYLTEAEPATSMRKRDLTKHHHVTLFTTGGKVKYKGEVQNDLYDGWGVLKLKNGKYAGYWTAGKKNGYGEEVQQFVQLLDSHDWIPKTVAIDESLIRCLREVKYAGKVFCVIICRNCFRRRTTFCHFLHRSSSIIFY